VYHWTTFFFPKVFHNYRRYLVAKDMKSSFTGSLRDRREAANAETDKVNAKIDEAFKKLAKKMISHADKAKNKIEDNKKPEKRAKLIRRYELYASAAAHLKEHLTDRSDESGGD
jgi:hypothetical protein